MQHIADKKTVSLTETIISKGKLNISAKKI